MKENNLKPSEEKAWQKYQNEEAINFDFPKTTAYNLIYELNKDQKNNTAISYGAKDISYGELFYKIEETKDSLKNKVKPGEIVSVASLNTPELIYLFYALGELHAITNMMDPRTNYQGLVNYISEADSTKLLTLNLFNDKLKDIMKDTKIKNIINVSLRDSSNKLPFKYNLVSLITDIKAELQYRDGIHIKFDDYMEEPGVEGLNNNYEYGYRKNLPLTIVHTGGTTGVPKGVMLSHDGYNAMAWQYKTSGIDLQRHHRFLNMMPPFLAYGSDMFHMPFVIGMKVDLIPIFDSNKFDRLVDNYKPSHFAGVPNHMMALVKSKKLQNKDLSYIITAAAGGDGITSKNHKIAHEFLVARGAKNGVSAGYALSEVNSVFSVCIGDNYKYGSCGYPLPGATIGIFDENQNELDYDEVGELCLRTPTQMIEYHCNEEETKKVLQVHEDGHTWVHTGDLGYIDRDGFIWHTDRIKHVIVKSDGFKIYPSKIEDVINSHYAVETSRVIGIPDAKYDQGELPQAHIILKEEYAPDEQKIISEIKMICDKELAEYVVPVDYKVRDSFPYTPIGKVDVVALKKEELNNDSFKTLKKVK